MASFSLAPFQSLLRLPGTPRLVVSSLVGRVPASMGPLSVVLLVQSMTGSYAHAGSAAGVFAIATAVASPLLGRLIDRVGQTRVLMSCGTVFAAAFATLAVVAGRGVNMMVVLGCVALAGLANPPLAPSMRTLWSAKLDGSTLQTAYALESTMQEVIFITGPLLVALLVTTISPAAAVLAAAGLAFVGTVSFATSPASRAWRAQPRTRDWAGPLRDRGVRTLVAVMVLLAVAFGLLQMGLLIVLAGLPIAPWLACTYLLVDRLSPAGTVTEAFTWVLTGFLTGQSIGASLAGMLIDASGPWMALFAATASLALAAVVAATRLATFARSEQGDLDHKRGRDQRP